MKIVQLNRVTVVLTKRHIGKGETITDNGKVIGSETIVVEGILGIRVEGDLVVKGGVQVPGGSRAQGSNTSDRLDD